MTNVLVHKEHFEPKKLHEKCPIRSFFFLNLRIQSEYGKIRTRKNSLFGLLSPSERNSIYHIFLIFVNHESDLSIQALVHINSKDLRIGL